MSETGLYNGLGSLSGFQRDPYLDFRHSESRYTMSRITWETHNGHDILCGNYANASAEEVIAAFAASNRILIGSKEQVLVFVDVTNISLDRTVFLYLRNPETKRAAKHIKKAAIIGLNAIAAMGLDAYNRIYGIGVKSFRDKPTTLDWLTMT
ncbi:MAG: hypothetical protein JXR76_14475 [Deltaproteobacteria bacterium]|nr:hypothetical protein [Deltaproteobacteria bacterium]